MLYQLNLSLLEVLFIYTIKMSHREWFSLTAHTPLLQLVTSLPNYNKGWTKWHVLVSRSWSGSIESLNHFFSPIRFLDLPSIDFPPLIISVLLFGSIIIFKFRIGKEKNDHLVEWVEKLFWDCLNKLFEIDLIERKIFVLLIEKNFKCVLNHQCSFVILVFSWFALSSHVPNEYFLLKDLKVYEVTWLIDIEVWQTCLDTRERKH